MKGRVRCPGAPKERGPRKGVNRQACEGAGTLGVHGDRGRGTPWDRVADRPLLSLALRTLSVALPPVR